MQDVAYIGLTIGFFGLLWVMVRGCERFVGGDDVGTTPGGLSEEPSEAAATAEVGS